MRDTTAPLTKLRPPLILALGGLAGLFDRGTDIFDALEGDLTMHGLVLIADRNRDTT